MEAHGLCPECHNLLRGVISCCFFCRKSTFADHISCNPLSYECNNCKAEYDPELVFEKYKTSSEDSETE